MLFHEESYSAQYLAVFAENLRTISQRLMSTRFNFCENNFVPRTTIQTIYLGRKFAYVTAARLP